MSHAGKSFLKHKIRRLDISKADVLFVTGRKHFQNRCDDLSRFGFGKAAVFLITTTTPVHLQTFFLNDIPYFHKMLHISTLAEFLDYV